MTAAHSYGSTCQIGSEFKDMDLRGADFSHADLSYARFEGCDLYGADFSEAMLYHCTFVDCDLTKATFEGAYLSGFRLRDDDITHVNFDKKPIVGAVRKPIAFGPTTDDVYATRGWLSVDRGDILPPVATLESSYEGIYCPSYPFAIVFSSDPVSEQWRSSRRRAEVCKILRIQLQGNGYAERSLDYYFEERRFRRMALPPSRVRWIRRFGDYVLGELFWGYSTRPVRPIIAYGVLLAIVSLLYVFMPAVVPSQGMGLADGAAGTIALVDSGDGVAGFVRVLYVLATCAFGTSGFEPTGPAGQLVFAAYCVVSLAILTFMFAAISRRIGQS